MTLEKFQEELTKETNIILSNSLELLYEEYKRMCERLGMEPQPFEEEDLS